MQQPNSHESEAGIGLVEEVAPMLRQLREFFRLHGQARFTEWGLTHGAQSPKRGSDSSSKGGAGA